MQIMNDLIFPPHLKKIFIIILLHLFSISGGLVYSYLTFQSSSNSSPQTANQEEEELRQDVEEPHNISEKRQY